MEDFDNLVGDVPESIFDTSPLPSANADAAQSAAALPSTMLTVETLETTFDFLFNLIATGVGPGGEFWQLKPLEREQLAKAWLPIIGPLLDSMGASKYAQLMVAVGMTGMSLGPRLLREKNRRASAKAATETASAGASPSSQAPQGLESLLKPTGS